MQLAMLYEKHGVEDKLKGGKKILLVCPEKGYDISSAIDEFLFDETQYEITWPKSKDSTVAYDILMEECKFSGAELILQLNCKFTKKLSWCKADGSCSPGLTEKINRVRGQLFVNLHHHDEFSIRDGLGKIEDLVKLLQSRDQTICAVTNHGAIGGWIKQYNQCRKAGIKPLFGIEAYINNYRGDDPEERKLHRSNFHLVMLARNLEGFYNIIKIHNEAQLNGFYYRPRCNHKTITENGKGIIGTSACFSGEIPQALLKDDFAKAKEIYELYKEAFDEFYIELTMIEWDDQVEMNRKLIQFAKQVGAPLIVTLDSHYLYPEFADTHDILLLIRDGKTVLDKVEKPEEVWQFDVRNLYYREEKDVWQLWEEKYKDAVFTKDILTDAIENTRRIAVKIDNIKLDSAFKLPKLYKNADEELKAHAREGLKRLALNSIPKYNERLEYELEVITKLGFAGYFLVVEKIVKDTKEKFGEWSVGYGRGSAGGSLVSYALNVTDLDPIKYGLLFERFLDPGRKDDCPDIDLDFQRHAREWVKQHVIEEFGEEHVCAIGTYQTYKTASVIIDCARALGLNVWEAMEVTKKFHGLTTFELDQSGDAEAMSVDQMEFEDLFRHYPELEQYFEQYPDVYQHAMVLRNQVKNMGKHAGGVIISDLSLQNYVPVYRDKGGERVSTWTEGLATHELSAVGLIKFDLLGLKNLDIIQDTVNYIEKTRGKRLRKQDIDINDKKAIRTSSKQDLVGIFQFENPATKPISDAVRMESIFDIGAVTSLIRPGPRDMGMDKQYSERKHGIKNYKLLDCLKSVLSETYGIIVYQEQVMKVSEQLSYFEPEEANRFRKVLVKEKNPEILEKMRIKFVQGAQKRVRNGEVSQQEIEDWWELCKAFAGYGFCKAHAFEYAAVSGAEFWLKYYFPTEFLTALMNNASTTGGKNALPGHVKYINYARKIGLNVEGPSVNKSGSQFRINSGNIVFALSHIKQVGKSAALIEEMQPFSGVDDFFSRIPKRQVNKRVFMSLVGAGAFDEFGSRNEVQENYFRLRKEKTYPDPLTDEQWQEKESEVLGICLTRKPILLQYKSKIKQNRWSTIGEASNRGTSTMIFGRITNIIRKTSKNGNEMLVVTLSDDIDSMKFYVWSSAFMMFTRLVKKGYIIGAPLKKFEDGDARYLDIGKDIIVVSK